MKAKNITVEQLKHALKTVNKKYGYRLEFNRKPVKPVRANSYIHFTIKSKESGIPGARNSWTGRKLVAASWHAHGYFFDVLMAINPKVKIVVSGNQVIDISGGNWQDRNIGSIMHPCYFSETSIL